jgi:hypothetical protein
MAIVEQLGCSKVRAFWVPRMLTVIYKETKIICTNLTLEMRTSCCIFAWGMKPGLTIQNPNPSGIRWNGSIPKEEEIQESAGKIMVTKLLL